VLPFGSHARRTRDGRRLGPREPASWKNVSRRRFIKNSGAALAELGSFNSARSVWAQVAGANDRIRWPVGGSPEEGIEHIKYFRELPGVQVAALRCRHQFLDLEVKKLKTSM